MPEEKPQTRARDVPWRAALLVVVLAGTAARGALLARGIGPADDPDNYLPLARSLAAGRGFAQGGRPTAYRPPLYPLVLAPVVALAGPGATRGVAALHLALGAVTVVLTAATARRWGLPRGAALGAAAVVAFDPVLVSQARAVMTETLAAALTAAALAGCARGGRRGAVLGGLAFGLGALCRPSLLPAAGLAALAALVTGRGPWRQRVAVPALLLAACAGVLAPWAARNAVVFGTPVVTTTHGGYTLFLANNPVYYDEVVNGPPGAVWTGHNQWLWWDEVNRTARGMAEPAADRLMRDRALSLIAARPADFARASLARLGRFWGVAPAGAVYPLWLRVATAVWTVPLWVALAAGLARREAWGWPRGAAPAVILGLTLVHTAYWTDLRMRAPMAPAVALVAAGALGRYCRGG